MSAILLSIHPEHVDKILSGEKTFEFRKRIPKQPVTHIVIYATVPVRQVVAIAEMTGVIEGAPEQVWRKTSKLAGIPKWYYSEYFSGRDKAYALCLGLVQRACPLISLDSLKPALHAPQSYTYLSQEQLLKISRSAGWKL